MENALNQRNNIKPTFHSKTQKNPLMGTALLEDLPRTTRGTRRKRRDLCAQKKEEKQQKIEDEEEEEEDEKTEVKRKIVALQRIVPGGEALGVDKLFEETADYILALQCQIKTMKALTSVIEGLEKQKRKLGG